MFFRSGFHRIVVARRSGYILGVSGRSRMCCGGKIAITHSGASNRYTPSNFSFGRLPRMFHRNTVRGYFCASPTATGKQESGTVHTETPNARRNAAGEGILLLNTDGVLLRGRAVWAAWTLKVSHYRTTMVAYGDNQDDKPLAKVNPLGSVLHHTFTSLSHTYGRDPAHQPDIPVNC